VSVNYALIQSLGEDVTYYARSLGSRNSETNQPAESWDGGTTIRVIMYKIQGRVEDRGDTRGVSDQRWIILSTSALSRSNRVKRADGTYYLVDSDSTSVKVAGQQVAYSCEAASMRLYA
jgi:hypothetical protein